MNIFRLGDSVELIVGPDMARFTGVLTDWDEVAIYVNGLGFPREDIREMVRDGV